MIDRIQDAWESRPIYAGSPVGRALRRRSDSLSYARAVARLLVAIEAGDLDGDALDEAVVALGRAVDRLRLNEDVRRAYADCDTVRDLVQQLETAARPKADDLRQQISRAEPCEQCWSCELARVYEQTRRYRRDNPLSEREAMRLGLETLAKRSNRRRR